MADGNKLVRRRKLNKPVVNRGNYIHKDNIKRGKKWFKKRPWLKAQEGTNTPQRKLTRLKAPSERVNLRNKRNVPQAERSGGSNSVGRPGRHKNNYGPSHPSNKGNNKPKNIQHKSNYGSGGGGGGGGGGGEPPTYVENPGWWAAQQYRQALLDAMNSGDPFQKGLALSYFANQGRGGQPLTPYQRRLVGQGNGAFGVDTAAYKAGVNRGQQYRVRNDDGSFTYHWGLGPQANTYNNNPFKNFI